MFSVLQACSQLRPPLTWCRILYIKQQRLQSYSKFSKYNKDSEGQFDSTRDKVENEIQFETKPSRRHHVRNGSLLSNRTDKISYQERLRPLLSKELIEYYKNTEEINAEEMFKSQSESKNLGKDNRYSDQERRFVSKSSKRNTDYEKNLNLKSTSSDHENQPLSKPSKIKHSKMKTNLPKDWSETFGTLVEENLKEEMEKSSLVENERYMEEMEKERKETDHIYNHIRLARYGRSHEPVWYARQIKKLGKEGKVREAIEVFETWMLKQDRVKPTGYEFSVIIDLLAQVGYTEKAFELYNLMRKLRIYIEDPIYTCLFNACANSPFQNKALQQIDSLYAKMLCQGRQPHYITRLAIIKAYGMNGDIDKAFRVADEALETGLSVDLMNNLLVACISDKKAGFRHAVVAWRKFRKLGIKPTLRSYKLLLHAVDVCGIGDPLLVNKLLGVSDRQNLARIANNEKALEGKIPEEGENKERLAGKKSLERNSRYVQIFNEIDSILTKYNMTLESNQDIAVDVNDSFNNNFDYTDSESDIVSSDGNAIDNMAVDKKVEIEPKVRKEWWQMDIFENTTDNEIESRSEINEISEIELDLPNILDPNEKLSSVIQVKQIQKPEDRLALLGGVRGILESLKKDDLKPDRRIYTYLAQSAPRELQDELIDEMWAIGMKPDIFFYNILLKKRRLHDKDSAWALYSRLKHEEVVPDMKTFTCLSTACRTHTDCLKILQDMDNAELQPNKIIFTALLDKRKVWFNLMREILCRMEDLNIKADKFLVKVIEKQIHRAKERIVSMEKAGKEEEIMTVEKLRANLSRFLEFYDKWAARNILEAKEHPWKHFMPKEQ